MSGEKKTSSYGEIKINNPMTQFAMFIVLAACESRITLGINYLNSKHLGQNSSNKLCCQYVLVPGFLIRSDKINLL